MNSMQVCERDGKVFENNYFRVLIPEQWTMMSRLKGMACDIYATTIGVPNQNLTHVGALTKDKYRLQAISPGGQAVCLLGDRLRDLG